MKYHFASPVFLLLLCFAKQDFVLEFLAFLFFACLFVLRCSKTK
ncbi:MAG: transporter [Ruminococcaceae bacterium]|nr:transporter [Oscillospiraceae bacterium]